MKKKKKETKPHPTCNPDNEEPDDDVVNTADRELSLNSALYKKISTGMRAALNSKIPAI